MTGTDERAIVYLLHMRTNDNDGSAPTEKIIGVFSSKQEAAAVFDKCKELENENLRKAKLGYSVCTGDISLKYSGLSYEDYHRYKNYWYTEINPSYYVTSIPLNSLEAETKLNWEEAY